MLKAVLFDIDGTLISLDGAMESTQKAIKQLGLSVPTKETLLPTFGYTAEEYFPMLFPGKEDLLEEFKKLKNQVYYTEHLAKPFEHTPGVLAAVKEKGLKIGIVTTNRRERALFIMVDNNLSFDALVGVDDIENRKPAPDGILKACRDLGVKPEEVIMVGDHIFDIQAGKAAGVYLTIGVTTGRNTREELEAEADKVVDDIRGVLDFL